MKKYTIKQMEPDYDFYYPDYLMEITNDDDNPIFIEGTNRKEGINEKWLFKVMDLMEECVEDYSNHDIPDDPEESYSIEDIVKDYFSSWNDKQIKKFIDIATELYGNNCTWEDEITARYLSIFYNKEYTYKEISGYSQGEYGVVYYPTFVNDGTIDYIEALYFGKYDEFYLEDEDNSYSAIVTHSNLWSDPKKAVAEAFDLNPEEIEVYEITGYQQVPTYQVMS